MKTTGSVRKTLLDSLLMEAAITWELTAKRFLSWLGPSTSIFTVAFSVDRKDPKFLYRMNTTFTCPAHGGRETQKDEEKENQRENVRTWLKRKGSKKKKRQMLYGKGDTERTIKGGGGGKGKKKDQIQKWGHNMVMAARVSGE